MPKKWKENKSNKKPEKRPIISDVFKSKSGKQYTVVFVEPVSPDDEIDIMYTVQGR